MFSNEALSELRGIASAAGRSAFSALQGFQLPVAHEERGRILVMEDGINEAHLSLKSNGEILYGVDRLSIGRRALHTLKEGNSYFLRTNSNHGLLALALSGMGMRLTLMDGTWLGDVLKERFLDALEKCCHKV